MKAFFTIYLIWFLVFIIVGIVDGIVYADVDFAMQTDAPHWTDEPILAFLFYVIALPVLIPLMIAFAIIFVFHLLTGS